MTDKKPNYFVRTLIVCLGILIGGMVLYQFTQQGEINNTMLIALTLMTGIFLSEAFDNFSVGKLLTMEKSVKEKKEEIKEVKKEKDDLLAMVVNNISLKNQSQQNVGLMPRDLQDIFNIMKADPLKVENEIQQKEEELSKTSAPNAKRIDFKKVEAYALDRFLAEKSLPPETLQPQIQFNSQDPISTFNPIFDGLIEHNGMQIFIEVRPQRSGTIREMLYAKLNNIYHLAQKNKGKAYLQLLLIEFPDDEQEGKLKDQLDKVEQDFRPALQQGVLKIDYLHLSEQQMIPLYK